MGKAARGEPGGSGTGSPAQRVRATGGCEPLEQLTANTMGLLETHFEGKMQPFPMHSLRIPNIFSNLVVPFFPIH